MSRLFKHKPQIVTYKYGGSHKGIDLIPSDYSLDDVICHSDGKVIALRNDYTSCNEQTGNSYGNYVEVDHGQGYSTLYAHLKAGSVSVSLGQEIKQGDILGYMWNSGRSNGKHLHFEVKYMSTKIDPTPYINANLPIKMKDQLYYLPKQVKGYRNCYEALERKNAVAVYSKGNYYVFNEALGMVNITKTKGVPGAWINPEDHQENTLYINIPPTLESCCVYPLNALPIVGYEIGRLASRYYGGLSYKVVNENTGYPNVVEIVTNSFSHVHIYVGKENGLSLTKKPLYTTQYDKSE